MNTIQIQLNDKQYQDLLGFLSDAQNEFYCDAQEEALEALYSALEGRSYLWTSSHGEVDLDIPAEHIDAICHSGDNEPACRAAIEEDGYLRAQLNAMDLDKAREYLKDAGIEDVDSKDEDLVRVYILWMACWDIHEERNMED